MKPPYNPNDENPATPALNLTYAYAAPVVHGLEYPKHHQDRSQSGG